MVVLIALFICHFLADYTHLSTNWMLSAKRLGTPLFPIAAHAFIHALLMFLVMVIIIDNENPLLIISLTLFQFATHFGIDVLKGKMNYWFPSLQNPANKLHWYMFGFDQLLHAIVIIIMASYVA